MLSDGAAVGTRSVVPRRRERVCVYVCACTPVCAGYECVSLWCVSVCDVWSVWGVHVCVVRVRCVRVGGVYVSMYVASGPFSLPFHHQGGLSVFPLLPWCPQPQ